jgi:hypothetical protein
MKIAMIGGRRKNLTLFNKIAAENGHELLSNELLGQSMLDVRRSVERADLVVILTDVNSHNAMHVAKQCAKSLGLPTLIIKQLGATRFKVLLQAIHRRKELGWIWGGLTPEVERTLRRAS